MEVESGERVALRPGRRALVICGRSGTLDAASKAEEVRLVDHYCAPLSEVRRVVD